MDEEVDQVARYLDLKRAELTSVFLKACRDKPSMHWDDIDAAVEANKEIESFDYYADKYLGYVYDDIHCCFRHKTEFI